MKTRFLAAAAAILMAVPAMADIQNPPLDSYTAVRKLGRGLGNIAFGVTEIPDSMLREQRIAGTKAAWSVGLTDGAWRTIKRVGYGAFETVTFTVPTFKGTYKQPYKRGELYPNSGMKEFAPELGFQTGTSYCRE
jgi:putative exosortase-associated protein (TIGR04073 family)